MGTRRLEGQNSVSAKLSNMHPNHGCMNMNIFGLWPAHVDASQLLPPPKNTVLRLWPHVRGSVTADNTVD